MLCSWNRHILGLTQSHFGLTHNANESKKGPIHNYMPNNIKFIIVIISLEGTNKIKTEKKNDNNTVRIIL